MVKDHDNYNTKFIYDPLPEQPNNNKEENNIDALQEKESMTDKDGIR